MNDTIGTVDSRPISWARHPLSRRQARIAEMFVTRRRRWWHLMDMKITVEEASRRWSDDLRRYATMLVGPHDALDVVAEAVAGALTSDRWVEVDDPRAYLYRAVLNAARMHARSQSRARRREEAVARLTVDRSSADPAPVDRQTDIREALDRLSPQQRAVIFLTYWEDLTPARIAEVLSVSDGSVRRQLARARHRLREQAPTWAAQA